MDLWKNERARWREVGVGGVDDEKGSLFLWCVAMTRINHNGTGLSPGHGGRHYQNKRPRFTYIMCPPHHQIKKEEDRCILLSVNAKTRFYLCRASRLLCQPHAVGNIANPFFNHQPHKFSSLHYLEITDVFAVELRFTSFLQSVTY